MPKSAPKYADLAAAIQARRIDRNLTQGEVASTLGFRQQSVSRWEAGTHRPTIEQIPALARLLRFEIHELMALADYGAAVTTRPAESFPFENLDPESFEFLVSDVIRAAHPEATVAVQGSRGHDQGGTDILATFPDKSIWSFQCKRVERFGKAEIDKAVGYHSIPAARKFLVLSRTASPQAATALAAHDGWTLWDKQVLSAQIRDLPIVAQTRLVDIYFRGKRMALIGRDEPGPWVDTDAYFAPFENRSGVLSHDWPLVGRDEDIAKLEAALLTDDKNAIVLLVGAGGIGKTRILKEAIERFAPKRASTLIRFLSSSVEPDPKSLEDLGNGPKLLIVDDAHDRDGLGLLIAYAGDERNQTRLLISTRPYADRRIRNDLGLANIVEPPLIHLDRLKKPELTELVVEVLKEFDGEEDWADAIIGIASDSPLVAAMAARVVAREGLATELARSEKGVREIILARFTDVIAGNLGDPADAPLLRAVLEVLALIQPFHVDDHRIGELVTATHKGIEVVEVTRALKLLVNGGVIYKRGALHRLMPDLLGDFLIERSCIGADGELSPFAIAAAKAVDPNSLSHLLVNLGRMDWRRAEGDPSNSLLLRPLWDDLKAIDNKYDRRIAAVEAVAYYQPAQAMAFVQAQIETDQRLTEFGTILRRIAMTPEYRQDALRLLLDLGRIDERDAKQNHSHPFRVLGELLGYDERKPLGFIEEIADFVFGLVDEPDAWDRPTTPLSLLEPLLSGQGMTTRWTGRGVSFAPFFISHDAVASLRARVIDLIFAELENPNLGRAHAAALFLNNAVRAPYGAMGASASRSLLAKYDAEFGQTMDRIDTLVASGTLAPTTLIGIARSLSWHAEYGAGKLNAKAKKIFSHYPTTLDFRLFPALSDQAGWAYVGQIDFKDWHDDRDWSTGFVDALVAAFEPSALADQITATLATLAKAGEAIGQSGPVIDKIIAAEPRFGEEIIRRAEADPDGLLNNYLGFAIGTVLDQSPAKGRTLVSELLSSASDRNRGGAVRALIGVRREIEPGDIALLAQSLSSGDFDLSSTGIFALRSWRSLSERQVIELALKVPFEREAALFDGVATLLCSKSRKLIERLSDADAVDLLERMKALPNLQGHWSIELLQGLAIHHTHRTAGFLFDRAEVVLSDDVPDKFSVVGYSMRHGHLGFESAAAAADILPIAWDWLRSHDESDGWMRSEAARIFAGMFKLDHPLVVDFMESILDRVLGSDLTWIGDILRHAHHSFVIKHARFIERLLERCQVVDRAVLKDVSDNIYIAATTGSWTGTSGEPTPRDVKTRDGAAEVLGRLSRLAPAYPLFRDIKEDAERNISRSVKDGQAMDEEEGAGRAIANNSDRSASPLTNSRSSARTCFG